MQLIYVIILHKTSTRTLLVSTNVITSRFPGHVDNYRLCSVYTNVIMTRVSAIRPYLFPNRLYSVYAADPPEISEGVRAERSQRMKSRYSYGIVRSRNSRSSLLYRVKSRIYRRSIVRTRRRVLAYFVGLKRSTKHLYDLFRLDRLRISGRVLVLDLVRFPTAINVNDRSFTSGSRQDKIEFANIHADHLR